MGYCKPGTTCLTHGSQIPDVDTTVQNRTSPPGPAVPIPYPNVAEDSDSDGEDATLHDVLLFDSKTVVHFEPIVKPHLAESAADSSLDPADEIKADCEQVWDANKKDCNHFLKAVEKLLGWTDFGPNDNANAIVEIMEKSPKFVRIDSAKAAQKAANEGKFVIAGLRGKDQAKPSEHGHVAIVTKGTLNNGGAPTGYWGSLGGTPKKDSSLRWAWTAADMANVEYFSRR